MNEITIKSWNELPYNYTGHVKYTDGDQYWYKNGILHREDGPAAIYHNGAQYWWLDDKIYSKEAYYRELHKRSIITEQELFIELL